MKNLIITAFITLSSLFSVEAKIVKKEKTMEMNVIESLQPYQTKWVNSFNRGDFNECADMYLKDAQFIMYHGGGKDQHAVHQGQKNIRSFWKTVVEEMKLANMRATAPKYAVLSDKEVLVSYDQATFGNQENPEGEKFKAIIHSELWVKKGNQWFVKLDITEAI